MLTLRLPLVALLLVAPVAVGLHQTGVSDPETRDICVAVQSVELPALDRPGPNDRPALAGCVSVDLYFGLGVPIDSVRARKCAYLEMERGDGGPALGGRTILMMAYANGKGAARNFDVALKFACAIGGAPQDIAGRVRQLARLKASRWTGDTFSVCDHSSGRALYGQCAVLQERFDAISRKKDLDAMMATWKASDRRAFEALRRAADSFFGAHAAREADLEATVEVQERAFLEDSLLASLRQFEQKQLPSFSAADLREAQTAMDAAFARTQQEPRKWGTATSDGIRQTQQLWITYRDAWVGFAKSRYPSVGADRWTTWLTRMRTEMLDRFR